MSVLPNSGRRRAMPISPTSRYNALNNAGKIVNLFREYAARPSTRIRWMAGHGRQIPQPGRVPSGTFVVFMGAPGQLASTRILPTSSEAWRNIQYLRDVFSGRVKDIMPTRLGYWKRHVYGPGDPFPDLIIDMWDYRVQNRQRNSSTGVWRNIPLTERINPNLPVETRIINQPGTDFDRVCGVKDMNTGFKFLHKKRRTVSQVISTRGPGIYLIMACRASGERIASGNAMRNFVKSKTSGMTAQTYMRRVRTGLSTNAVNIAVQKHENNQARIATRKRARNIQTLRRASPSSGRTLPPALRRRPNANANTVMRNN